MKSIYQEGLEKAGKQASGRQAANTLRNPVRVVRRALDQVPAFSGIEPRVEDRVRDPVGIESAV
jgi:hypothetical protein